MWIDSTVGVILSRETYNGVLKIGDVVNELPELRIVTKRTFEKVKDVRKKRKAFRPRGRAKKPLVLREMFCLSCRSPLLDGMRFCPECEAKQTASRGFGPAHQMAPQEGECV